MGRQRDDYSEAASTNADDSTYQSRDATYQSAYDQPNYDRRKTASAGGISGLNRRLRTEFIDVDPNDESIGASLTRGVVGIVGSVFTPRQILVALRLLKALTVCFIVLTAAADIVYISMVEFVADNYYQSQYVGVRRDTILRIYGFMLAALALFIELDKFVMKNFKVLKGFIARFGLLFFISCVTYCHPQEHYSNGNYGDGSDTGVPQSAVVFQMVTSIVLALCSFTYLLFGLLCFDRFTSRAFLSTQDPVASTTIPSSGGTYESPTAA